MQYWINVCCMTLGSLIEHLPETFKDSVWFTYALSIKIADFNFCEFFKLLISSWIALYVVQFYNVHWNNWHATDFYPGSWTWSSDRLHSGGSWIPYRQEILIQAKLLLTTEAGVYSKVFLVSSFFNECKHILLIFFLS